TGWLHALALSDLGRGRSGQRPDERPGGFAVTGIDADGGRISRVILDVFRERPDQRDSLHRHDLADLMDAQFSLTVRNVLGHRAARDEHRLRLHRVGETESLE